MQPAEFVAEAIVELFHQPRLLIARLGGPRRIQAGIRSQKEGHTVGIVQPCQGLVQMQVVVHQKDMVIVFFFPYFSRYQPLKVLDGIGQDGFDVPCRNKAKAS